MTREFRAYIRDRERHFCLRCGDAGQDVAHILPRRWKQFKTDKRNAVFLCRRCHRDTETVEGRTELLRLLQQRYGYEYAEEAYQQYLRLGEHDR